jgi:hypothetical protein
MLIACHLTQSAKPGIGNLVAILDDCERSIAEDTLATYKDIALRAYKKLGGSDKVAKGSDLQKKLISKAKTLWKSPKKGALRIKGKKKV